MKAVRLIAAEDDFDSSYGFIIKGMPEFEGRFADRDGVGMAHDVLEHQNGPEEMGPVWDELEALGGLFQVRGRHGTLHTSFGYSDSRIHWNIASDVTRMFEQWQGEGRRKLPRTRPIEDIDDDFDRILSQARIDIPQEFGGRCVEDEKYELEQMEVYLEEALHRMRIGYRKAQKRFTSDCSGENLFVAIRDAVKNAVRTIEYEGEEFILLYGRGRAEVRSVDLVDRMEDY